MQRVVFSDAKLKTCRKESTTHYMSECHMHEAHLEVQRHVPQENLRVKMPVFSAIPHGNCTFEYKT